jgi:hypothetical protein
VASARGWHLAVVHAEPDGRRQPKYYLLDRRKCLDLLLALRRAWWRVEFQRAARAASPGARMEGLYVSSELVEVRRDLLGDHVRVLGVKLRRAGAVRAFRRSLVASMRLGRRFSAELARNAGRLAWPAAGTPPSAEVAHAGASPAQHHHHRPTTSPPRRASCRLPQPAGARVLAIQGPLHRGADGGGDGPPALAAAAGGTARGAEAQLLLAATAAEEDPARPPVGGDDAAAPAAA